MKLNIEVNNSADALRVYRTLMQLSNVEVNSVAIRELEMVMLAGFDAHFAEVEAVAMRNEFFDRIKPLADHAVDDDKFASIIERIGTIEKLREEREQTDVGTE